MDPRWRRSSGRTEIYVSAWSPSFPLSFNERKLTLSLSFSVNQIQTSLDQLWYVIVYCIALLEGFGHSYVRTVESQEYKICKKVGDHVLQFILHTFSFVSVAWLLPEAFTLPLPLRHEGLVATGINE
jgi:uncharacterized membrane protein YbjE (DUF340 family)